MGSHPTHPVEHLAEILDELKISRFRLGEGDRCSASPDPRSPPGASIRYGRHSALHRTGSKHDAGVLANVRSQRSPCGCRRPHDQDARGDGLHEVTEPMTASVLMLTEVVRLQHEARSGPLWSSTLPTLAPLPFHTPLETDTQGFLEHNSKCRTLSMPFYVGYI